MRTLPEGSVPVAPVFDPYVAHDADDMNPLRTAEDADGAVEADGAVVFVSGQRIGAAESICRGRILRGDDTGDK